MNRSLVIAWIAVAALLAVAIWRLPSPSGPAGSDVPVSFTQRAQTVPNTDVLVRNGTQKPQHSLERLPRSTLADTLNAPGGTAAEDVRIVQSLFENYVQALGENPVGNNREMTRALCGDNPRLHAPLPDDCAAINAQGELCDRWGRPYFFHSESRTRVSIRSRGADGVLFNEDDIVSEPRGY